MWNIQAKHIGLATSTFLLFDNQLATKGGKTIILCNEKCFRRNCLIRLRCVITEVFPLIWVPPVGDPSITLRQAMRSPRKIPPKPGMPFSQFGSIEKHSKLNHKANKIQISNNKIQSKCTVRLVQFRRKSKWLAFFPSLSASVCSA